MTLILIYQELDNQNHSLRTKLRTFMETRKASDANSATEIARLNAANEALSQQLAALEADVKRITTSNELLSRQFDSAKKAIANMKQANAASASAAAAAQATSLTTASSVPTPVPVAQIPAPNPVPVPVVAVMASTQVLADHVESSATSVPSSDSAADLTEQAQQGASKKRDRTAQESSETASVLATEMVFTSKPAPPAGPPPAQTGAVEAPEEILKKRILEKKATLVAASNVSLPPAVETTTTAAPLAIARPLPTGGPVAKKVRLGQPQIPKQVEVATVPAEGADMEIVVSTEEQVVAIDSHVADSIAEVPQPAKPIPAPIEAVSFQQPQQNPPQAAQLLPFTQKTQPTEQPPRLNPFVVSGGTVSSFPFGKSLNPSAPAFNPQGLSAPPRSLDEGEVGTEESSNPPRPQVIPPKTAPTTFLTTPAPGIATGIDVLCFYMFSYIR